MIFTHRQLGFSLFELVVFIVIVTLVLYAILPGFTEALRQAHETVVSMNARTLQEGVMRAKAIEMVDGLNGEVYDLPRFGDGTLDLSAAGFPTGTSRHPGDQLTGQHCAEVWAAVLEPNPEDPRGRAGGDFDATLGISGKNPVCIYSYKHGGAMTIGYDPATGEVWADAKFKGSVLSY